MGMSPEERRARDRERKRLKRAEEAAAREAASADKRTSAKADAPTAMREAVTDAIAAMKWLVPSDIASKMQALDLARIIDEATHEGDDARALSAHRALSRVLNDLGGTPSVRLARELRSLKQMPKVEGSDDERTDSTEPPQGSNVSKFQRPAKRVR